MAAAGAAAGGSGGEGEKERQDEDESQKAGMAGTGGRQRAGNPNAASAAGERSSVLGRQHWVEGGAQPGNSCWIKLDLMVPANLLIFWPKATAFPILLRAPRSTPKAERLQKLQRTPRERG